MGNFLEIAQSVQDAALKINAKVYLVGGAIRDWILTGVATFDDLDFTVEGSARDLAEQLQQKIGGKVVYHDKFLTATLGQVDFATCRKESYSRPGALPNVYAATLNEDLHRRDFSVNAMAVLLSDILKGGDFKGKIIDPCHGLQDLEKKIVRVLHKKSFIDDPTRLFRCVRYEARIGGKADQTTEHLFDEAVRMDVIRTISCHRLVNELKKIWQETNRKDALLLLFDRGIFLEDQASFGSSSIIFKEHLLKLLEKNASFEKFTYLLYLFLPFPKEEIAQACSFKKKTIEQLEGGVAELFAT